MEVENLNTLQHGFGKQKGRFYEFYNTGYDADSRNQILNEVSGRKKWMVQFDQLGTSS